MAYEELDVAPVRDGGEKSFAFEKTKSLAAAGSTSDYLMPDDIDDIAVTAEAAGGATITVYSTTDPISVVKSGSGATWLAWAAGAVTTATGASFNPVTAIKATQSGAGTSKLTIRAQ